MTREFIPHDYQQEALQHLYDVPRSALWAPMGSGKSVVTLTALEALDTLEPVYPALVLAPLRVCRSVWKQEGAKWGHTAHLRIVPVTGSAKDRAAALRQPADIYCVNYENLEWLVAHFGDKWPFKTIICDESTRTKSFRLRQGGQRAAALGKVAHISKRFIGLTGTPSPNGLKDLWGQLWFIDKGERLGRTYSAFEARWFRKGYDGFSLEPMGHAQSEIQDLLSDVCLTVKGLPVDEPIHDPIYIDLDAKSRALYKDMERRFFVEIEEQGIEAANAAVKVGKLLQISNGAIYQADESWAPVHNLKLEALESVLEEANGMPVLCSYVFRSDVERICKHFKQARVLDKDPKTIDRWNKGELPLLLAHPASAGHGLNMADGGNILTRFGLGWSLEEYMQILERIGPQRQKQAGYDRPVFDYPILARDTFDEVVLDRLQSKKSVQQTLLDALKKWKETC